MLFWQRRITLSLPLSTLVDRSLSVGVTWNSILLIRCLPKTTGAIIAFLSKVFLVIFVFFICLPTTFSLNSQKHRKYSVVLLIINHIFGQIKPICWQGNNNCSASGSNLRIFPIKTAFLLKKKTAFLFCWIVPRGNCQTKFIINQITFESKKKW